MITLRTVTLPVVAKLSFDDARRKLLSIGLRVERLDEPTDQAVAGTLLGSVPAAESIVERGTVVRLRVAAEIAVEVPNILGDRREDIDSTFESVGLVA